MAIVEFPNVKVDIQQSGYDNPRYLDLVLGEEKSLLANALAYALVCGVENSKKFVGATLDEYLLGAEEFHAPEIKGIEHLEWEALNVFVQKLSNQGWIYGVLPRESPFRGKYVLQTPREMIEYVQGTCRNYDQYCIKTNQKSVNNLLFVPSPKFTQEIWGFNYAINDLENMAEFALPKE